MLLNWIILIENILEGKLIKVVIYIVGFFWIVV